MDQHRPGLGLLRWAAALVILMLGAVAALAEPANHQGFHVVATDEKNIDNSIELIQKELAKLKAKPVSKAELDRTKSQIKGVMMLGLENMSGRMMRLGSSELYFESFTSLDTILKKVDAVTSEAIQHAANDLFREERFSTVIIRPS